MPEIREIKIVDIIIDQNINTRPVDPGTVAQYREDMREYGAKWQHSWKELPKITNEDYLWSGFHTIQAATEEFGDDHLVEVEIHGKTHRDAFFLATGENAMHGMPRSNAEKREAVTRWLMDDEMKLWSNSHIARKCNVSPQFVINVSTSIVEVEKGYTRPTRLKQIDRYGNETWKDYGTSEKESMPLQEALDEMKAEETKEVLKQAKIDHSNARLAVQSAFFDTNLHERMHGFETVETGKKLTAFFEIVVKVKGLRKNIFSHDYFCWDNGKNLELSEIQAETEVLCKIAEDIQFYMQGDEFHMGWVEQVLSDDAFADDAKTDDDPEKAVALEKFRNQKDELYRHLDDTPLLAVKDEFGNTNTDVARHRVMVAAHKAYALDETLLWSDQAVEALETEDLNALTGCYFLIAQDLAARRADWVKTLYQDVEEDETPEAPAKVTAEEAKEMEKEYPPIGDPTPEKTPDLDGCRWELRRLLGVRGDLDEVSYDLMKSHYYIGKVMVDALIEEVLAELPDADTSLAGLGLAFIKRDLQRLLLNEVGKVEHAEMRDDLCESIFDLINDPDYDYEVNHRDALSILIECALSIVSEG